MPNFEELFEDVIGKAKGYADVAGRKTSEVVELGKLKYQGKQIAWDIEKTYSRLGAIVYEARKNGGNYDDVVNAAIDELDDLNCKLDEIEEKIIAMKRPDFRGAHSHEEPEECEECPQEAPVAEETPAEAEAQE